MPVEENLMQAILLTFGTAMVPVLELRGAIPVGVAAGLSPAAACLVSILGNMVPVPFILLLILLERQLRKGPDLICHLGYQICFFFDGGDGRLLFCCHGDAPFCAGCPGPLKRARTSVRAPQLPGPAAQRAALGSGCLTAPC